MKYLYIIYQYLIAFPILWVLTMLTAIITIILFPWPNCKFVNWVQKLWSRSFGWMLFLPVCCRTYKKKTTGRITAPRAVSRV